MISPSGLHLRSIALDRTLRLPSGFPFNVPVIDALDRIDFDAPVTFFVGENGCGKSTLLEAIACAVGSITVGSVDARRDDSLAAVRDLGRRLKLTWSARTRRGFFMRSEDFFGYARHMSRLREELEADLERVDREYEGRSRTAQLYARAAYQGQISQVEQYYGEGLDVQSHGESYLELFQARFVPGGLYLLDEPEAPLSPVRQMSFLVLLQSMVEQEAQFIIATHSPIVMAYPGAQILLLEGGSIEAVDYEAVEHVQITRGFLNHPERYLDSLLRED